MDRDDMIDEIVEHSMVHLTVKEMVGIVEEAYRKSFEDISDDDVQSTYRVIFGGQDIS